MMHFFDDTIFERLLDALKVGDRVVVTSHLFHEYKTNHERVALAHQLLDEENLLPCLERKDILLKSRKLSEELRNEGNRAFQKKRDISALELYNRSLCAAPFNSKEYSLAIGNRSAVNWSLGFYEACLSDIDLALQHGYPRSLQLKLMERKVKCFLKLEMMPQAKEAIKIIETELNEMSVADLRKGNVMKDLVEETLCPQNCLSTLEKPRLIPFGCSQLPSLSYNMNPEIDCASGCVELKYSERKGRHLVATRNIRPGDVLIVEQPYSSVLLPNVVFTHCYNCLKRCLSPIPCEHCVEVMFCDTSCRSQAWEKFHSVDCPLLPYIYTRVGKIGLLALRVLLLGSDKGSKLKELYEEMEGRGMPTDARILGFNEEGHYVSTNYWTIHYLVGHSDQRSNADLFRRSVTAACILHCLETFSNFFGPDVDDEIFYFSGGLLLQYLQSLPCNAHEVSEMKVTDGTFESVEIGAAAYATLSLLNHSCDPNVVRHSYGDWAVLRAIRPIKEGEDVWDNYGYHHALHSVEERQSQLLNQYFFNCTCEPCQCLWPLYQKQPSENPTYVCSECCMPLSRSASSKVSCCGIMTDVNLLETTLRKSSEKFREIFSNVLDGKFEGTISNCLIDHLLLLATHIQRPWREFSECQETLKQCLSLQANHVIANSE